MDAKQIVLVASVATACAASPAAALPLTPVPHVEMSLIQQASRCRPIEFDGLDMDYDPSRGIYVLKISGTKPYVNMDVSLTHRSYYGRPAWWRTTVVGCLKSFGLPIPAPYWIMMPLDDFVGTKGVEIIGANGAARQAIPRR